MEPPPPSSRTTPKAVQRKPLDLIDQIRTEARQRADADPVSAVDRRTQDLASAAWTALRTPPKQGGVTRAALLKKWTEERVAAWRRDAIKLHENFPSYPPWQVAKRLADGYEKAYSDALEASAVTQQRQKLLRTATSFQRHSRLLAETDLPPLQQQKLHDLYFLRAKRRTIYPHLLNIW